MGKFESYANKYRESRRVRAIGAHALTAVQARKVPSRSRPCAYVPERAASALWLVAHERQVAIALEASDTGASRLQITRAPKQHASREQSGAPSCFWAYALGGSTFTRASPRTGARFQSDAPRNPPCTHWDHERHCGMRRGTQCGRKGSAEGLPGPDVEGRECGDDEGGALRPRLSQGMVLVGIWQPEFACRKVRSSTDSAQTAERARCINKPRRSQKPPASHFLNEACMTWGRRQLMLGGFLFIACP